MANTLTWLHLSDLHMRRDTLDDLRVVLDALWRDLYAQIQAGLQPDFIAFTGDIAYSGKEEESELAEEHFFRPLLEVIGLSPRELFVVPGNHDVDWDGIKYLNPEILASLTDRAKVNKLLKADAMRRLLLAPMAGYTQFIQRYFGPFPDHQILRDPPYYYVQTITSGNQSVALIGLNSTWLSGFNRDAEGNVDDQGNLLIGDKQISDAIREAEDATVRIVLVHHPFDWLKEFEKHDVQARLSHGCNLVLRGHLHEPILVKEKALSGEIITIPAGTVYESREWLNGYNLVQLNFDTGRGKIILRRYSEARREWVKDVQSTGDELDGLIQFDLPWPLGRPAPPPVPTVSLASQVLSEIKPSWLRLGRERDTQHLETFLQQEERDTLWIWGNEGCGLKEFLQIARALLQHEAADAIYFDAVDAAFGIAVDQHYFFDKLERWAGTTPGVPSGTAENIDKRLKRLLAGAEGRLAHSDRRLILIFANFHLLIPAVREWVWRTLWGQMLEPLRKYNRTLAIYACEGSAPICPASDQESKIYLAEFTVQDVERFLRTMPSVDPEEIPDLARNIHSESADEFLAPPRRVYQSLILQLIRLDAVSALDRATDAVRERDTAASILSGKIATGDFDVFLCYNSEDKPVVKEIGRRLRERGILPWLDEWELRPGFPWQRLLEHQIGQIKSAAVFVGKEGIGPWQQVELEAFLREFVSRGCPVIPVLLPGAPKKPRLPVFLRGMTWVDLRNKDPAAMEQLIWGITGERDWAL